MTKSILSVNAGSSSVKINFYTLDNPPREIVDASVSGITAPPVVFKYKRGSEKHKEKLDVELATSQDAFKFLLERCFTDPQLSEVASPDDLEYICHRVVHGGNYDKPVVITDETYGSLKVIEDLAPLYVPHFLCSSVS